MVLQKRLDYGFIGYQVPPIPRSTRSPRKRGISWRKADDTQMCAFDLLATVADKLLLEGESSPTSTNTSNGSEQSTLEKDSVDREKQNNEDRTMQEKSCKSFFLSELVSEGPTFNSFSYVLPHAQNDSLSPKSVITTSDSSDKFASVEKLVNAGSKVEPGSVDWKVFSSYKLGNTGVGRSRKHEILNNGKVSSTYNKVGMCGSDAVLWDRKPSTFVCSDNSVKLTLSKDHIPLGSFPVRRDNVKLGNRDDDENSSATNKASGPALPRIGDQRIKNLLASEYREVNPKSNDEERLNADVEMKPALSNKKNNLECERSLRDYPFKKRKLYDCSSVSNSERGISNDGNCSSHTKGYKEDASNYTPTAQKTAGTSNSAAFFSTGDSQVKLRIKSFRVPELFIEIPETSTVGSLKTTVMEAVTAILGGGLHIGVLFQGKKIRDDNKTLLQTGISRDNKLDTLGFSLEPIPSKASPSPCPEERPYLLSCDTPQPLRRYTPTRTVVHNIVQPRLADTLRDPPGTNLINFIESDHNSAPSPPDTSLDKSAADSRALVTVPSVNMEPHSVIPVRKPKRSEAAQRRIRRPFSVSEVEALVQAVEKLGTGRWRDVKLRAFDNAKHRTYVDLKDKWKTLVHTARISPQQRRGEPVPQELLDRVLIAHAYWSQQQAKQQMKQQAETCLLL